jgi:SAM-dependent MidA family methyltransferase
LGRRGDYYTSVSVGKLLGKLLACEFLRWFNNEKKENLIHHLCLIEVGAHDGSLAADILQWLVDENNAKNYQGFFKYIIVEPSGGMRHVQRNNLQKLQEHVLWIRDFESTTLDSFSGSLNLQGSYQIIFSNELLDAFPVHRLIWLKDKQVWMELGVGMDGDNFEWTIIEPCAECGEFITELNKDYSDVLQILNRDFILEYPSEALKWWRSACNFLKRGRIVVFDYGYAGCGLLNPYKSGGTLRCYYRHHIADSVFQNLGEQDITADVNFDFFIREAESLGLKKIFYGEQSKFLTKLIEENKITIEEPWFSKHISQFKTLVHPDHLGQVIKVLVMEKN